MRAILKSWYVFFSCWTDPEYLRYRWRRWRRTPELASAAASQRSPDWHHVELDDLTVDLVYMWVSGEDPLHRRKRDYWALKEGVRLTDTTHRKRFVEVDELRYSLRSVVQFAPWVRRVFIVTDGQVPSWFNIENPRGVVIDHSELFPEPEWLPSFNSSAIASQLHRIPGISEFFLVANDDTFLGQPCSPADFFDHTGSAGQVVPIVMNDPSGDGWIGPWHQRREDATRTWMAGWNNIKWALERRHPLCRVRKISSHQIQGMTKSVMEEAISRYPSEYRTASSLRFRSSRYLSMLALAGQDALLRGSAVAGWIDSRVYSDEAALMANIHLPQPPLFCVNSNTGDPGTAKAVYELLFPQPSEFEIPELAGRHGT